MSDPGGPRPRVSVAMITFQHERFIAHAIESVLMQDAGFPFELVIGDDASTDHTREVAGEYGRRHPGRVRLLTAESNQGVARNFVKTLRECRGQYVALLEGDDYWTRPDKMRKQADFLDAHPEHAACFHPVKVRADGEAGTRHVQRVRPPRGGYGLEDLLRANFMHTCSVMSRNHLIPDWPEPFLDLKMLDWPYHILNALRGTVGFLPEAMAVYRLHAASAWSAGRLRDRIAETRRMLERVNAHLGGRYDRVVRRSLAECDCQEAMQFAREGNRRAARPLAASCVRAYRSGNGPPLAALLALGAVMAWPALYRLVLAKKPLWR
ncbi:MAG TPA: glycosyltransferase [Kiritimatiellia bacterium]|nr:glycosyltransferase [Kiritimatiellia bacterium]HRZ13365.1 glycosyltransferase [Kiritimatiellia bacterium]HSA18995.1 glycosyltransferase [Kiritimatiellia bacterium]